MTYGAHNTKTGFEPHDETCPLYVDAKLRICVACPEDENIKPLEYFAQRAVNSNKYSVTCRRCRSKEDVASENTAQSQALATLTKTLSKATRTNYGAKSFTEVIDSVMGAMGGHDKGNYRIGRVFNRAMSRGLANDAGRDDLALAVKAGATLIDAAATIEKNRPESINPSDLTADEARMLLMEPARMMILDDEDFRRELLSDTRIRKLLLKELGVQTIDVSEPEEELV